jgi:hypothetical protein
MADRTSEEGSGTAGADTLISSSAQKFWSLRELNWITVDALVATSVKL